jgi:hypothetical protein
VSHENFDLKEILLEKKSFHKYYLLILTLKKDFEKKKIEQIIE